jgi:hypothetical protein
MSYVLKFDRSPVARLISCAGAFASAGLLLKYLSYGPAEWEPFPLIALAILFVGTVAAAIIQYGDHIYLSDDGVTYENRLLKLFGKAAHSVRWEDIVEVREIKEKILILLPRDGRRLLVDAILGYPIARNEILRRASHAVFSGTLAPEDS